MIKLKCQLKLNLQLKLLETVHEINLHLDLITVCAAHSWYCDMGIICCVSKMPSLIYRWTSNGENPAYKS